MRKMHLVLISGTRREFYPDNINKIDMFKRRREKKKERKLYSLVLQTFNYNTHYEISNHGLKVI